MPPWWLRLLVSVTVAAILFTFVPIGLVWNAIRGVSPWIWAASVGVFIGGHSLNALKLRLLLGPGRASAGSCLRAHFAGIAANLGLPGVAGGDIVRASYLAPAAGGIRVALTAVADRILDLLVLFCIAVAAASIAGLPPVLAGSAWTAGRWLALIVLAIAVLVSAARRWRPAAAGQVRAIYSGMVERPGAVVLAMTLSLTVQSAFVLTNVWLASEIGVTMALAPWFLAWTGAKLSAVLPISLGGIGVREATLVWVLAAYGAPADGVLAVGILWEGALVVGSTGGFLATQLLHRRGRIT